MVAAVSTAINPKSAIQRAPPQNPTRPPLLPSESDNALAPHRRPKTRQVTSRYMSSCTASSSASSSSSSSAASISRRCQSPLVSRTFNSTPTPSTPSVTKRSQSVERRRQGTPRPNIFGFKNGNGAAGEASAAHKLLTTTRSLSVSFQGESFSIKVSKAKPTSSPSPNVRKGTPERRKAITPAGEGGSRLDQQRWPGRIGEEYCMSRSVDFGDDRKQVTGSEDVVKALQNLIDARDSSYEGKVSTDTGILVSGEPSEMVVERNPGVGSEPLPDDVVSDTESASSGSTSGALDPVTGSLIAQPGIRGSVAPARFSPENNYRLRRQTEPVSAVSKNTGNKIVVPPKLLAPKKLVADSPTSSPRGVSSSRGQLSPIRAAIRPASPSKLATPSTSSRVSPSRVRNGIAGAINTNLTSMPSVLSFAVDVRRGKIGENQIFDAHLLRLLHNRLLQWRFVNARAYASLSEQRLGVERILYNAWVTTFELRESVKRKRIQLQSLRLQFRIFSILKEQMDLLEDWALLDQEYSSSLSGAIEALRASTLRLPVIGGAKADILDLKDAICSAVDVMQAMASSICLLLPKVGNINSLATELANLSLKECIFLDQCKDLLSVIAAMQVTECSLRIQTSQLKCVS